LWCPQVCRGKDKGIYYLGYLDGAECDAVSYAHGAKAFTRNFEVLCSKR